MGTFNVTAGRYGKEHAEKYEGGWRGYVDDRLCGVGHLILMKKMEF